MSTEARVGLVALLGIAVLAGVVVFLRGGAGFRDRGYDLNVVVRNAGGIAVGAPVQMAGIQVGRVTGMEFTPERRARITVRIRAGVTIPSGSRFAIATLGLLGDRFIAIVPELEDRPPLPPGATVEGADPFTVEELYDRVVAVAASAQEALANINRLIGEPALAGVLGETVRNARDATAVIRQAAANVERTTQALDRAVGTDMPQIAAVMRTMASDLAGSAGAVREIVQDVAAGGQTAAQVRAAIASIERAAAGIEKMVRDLSGLINEGEVRAVRESLAEARGAITEARQAVGEVRAAVGRADRVVERVGRILPERLELPDLRTTARVEYGLWYDGQRLGHDVSLVLQPEAPTSYIFMLREAGGANRVGLQIGNRLDERLTLRYGVIDSYLGVGLDYRASPSLDYAVDLYNIGRISLNVSLRYAITRDYALSLRAHSLFNEPTFGVGVIRRF
jgi:phospholipid/cholesterol/gamma-HCH transport system substrate-binding protein